MFIVDSREPASIAAKLESLTGEAPTIAKLSVGDIMFPHESLLIERKTVTDLLASIGDGRFANQCSELARFEVRFPVLLVHGSLLPSRDDKVVADGRATNWYYWSVIMALVSAQAAGIIVVLLPDSVWADFVVKMRAWASKSHHLVPRLQRTLWHPTTQVRLLSLLVGTTSRASALMEKYGTVEAALSDIENWDKVRGIGSATVTRAIEILRSQEPLDL